MGGELQRDASKELFGEEFLIKRPILQAMEQSS